MGRGDLAKLLAPPQVVWQGDLMGILNAISVSRGPAASFAIIGMFWGCFAAHMPVLKAQIGASDSEFGVLLVATGLGLATSMWLAPLTERKLGRFGLRYATLLFAATFALPSLANDKVAFGLILLLLGATSGLTDVIMNARVSVLEARLKRPLMSANHGVFSAAYAVAAIISGFAREAMVPPPLVFAGFAVLAVALAFWAPADEQPAASTPSKGRSGATIPVLLCGGVVLVAFMTEATVETWSALHIERTLMGGAAEGAMGPATLGIMMAIGRFSGQAISERVRDLTVITVATVLCIIGVLIAAAAPTPLIAYLGFGIVGLGVSVIGPLGISMVGRLVPGAMRTAAISRVAVIGFAGFFVAPLLMGLISDGYGLRIAYASVAVLLLLIFPLAGKIRNLPVH